MFLNISTATHSTVHTVLTVDSTCVTVTVLYDNLADLEWWTT